MALPYACWLIASTISGSELRATPQARLQLPSNAALSVGVSRARMLWSWFCVVILIATIFCKHEALAVEISLAGQFATNGFVSSRVALAGNFAYVAGGSSGMHVLDVSQPGNPVRVGTLAIGGYTLDIAISGNYAVVAKGFDGFQVLDISNPANPQLVGSYTNNSSANVIRVAASGTHAYAVTMGGTEFTYGFAMQIFDIVNPTQPIRTGYYSLPNWHFSLRPMGGALAVRSNHVFFGWGRVFNQEGWYTEGGMVVLNVSNPTNPVTSGTRYLNAWVSDIGVSGNYAYLAYGGWSGGLFNPMTYYGGLATSDVTNLSELPGKIVYYTNTIAGGVAALGNKVLLTC